MNNERILPFAMATKLSDADIKDVSAASGTVGTTYGTTFSGQGTDVDFDVTPD